jgi:hypothetical protein
MKQTYATLLGFALAPLVPAGVFSATSPGLTGSSGATAIGLVPIFYVFALLFTGVLAVPLYLCLKRWGGVTWRSVLIGGTVIGAAAMTVMQATAEAAVFGAGIGASEALVFWAIRRLGRVSAFGKP